MRIVQNIMQMLLSQAFLHSPYLFQKYRLTNPVDVRYNFNVVALGAWCNGNTWVSKTFVEGSNPSAPAQRETLQLQRLQGSFVHPCSSHSRWLGVYLFIHPALHMKEMSGGRISPAILAVLLDN